MQDQEDGSVWEGHKRTICTMAPLFQICLAALAFAWKKKHDSQFFTESLRDATKDLDLALEEYSRTHLPPSPNSHSPDSAEEAERVSRRQRLQDLSHHADGSSDLIQIWLPPFFWSPTICVCVHFSCFFPYPRQSHREMSTFKTVEANAKYNFWPQFRRTSRQFAFQYT